MSESKPRFRPGDRVRVAQTYHWAKGALGTVEAPPKEVDRILHAPTTKYDGKIWRRVAHVDGSHLHYSVRFDEAQLDSDGDGPFGGAEIDGNYLEALG
jgi:hypothetical protein